MWGSWSRDTCVDAVNSDERLEERHLGGWEGLTKDEAHTAFDSDWTRLTSEGIEPPQWETSSSAASRVHRVLTESHQHGTGPLLVVSHAGPITCLQRHLTGRSTEMSNLEGIWAIIEPESVTLLGRQHFTDRQAPSLLL